MVNLWSKYRNTSTKNKQTLHSLFVGFVLFIALFIITKIFSIPLCPIYNIFGIRCIGCGLSRGFIAILRLDFDDAYKCNLLAIPLFIGIVLYTVLAIIDFIFEKQYLTHIERRLSNRYMYLIYIPIVIIATILNNRI